MGVVRCQGPNEPSSCHTTPFAALMDVPPDRAARYGPMNEPPHLSPGKVGRGVL
jgi:hypothetical protein